LAGVLTAMAVTPVPAQEPIPIDIRFVDTLPLGAGAY
jgi:hypothetical protein